MILVAEMNADKALSLLWQAARPSPHLREAVELVEIKIARLEALLSDAINGASDEHLIQGLQLIDGKVADEPLAGDSE